MASSPLPLVSVIVPVRDGLAGLRRCVDALLAQDYPAELLEILVVDNGSAIDPGPHLPRDRRLRLLTESAPGSYAARNAAVAVARGDVLAFTDADCLPARDWVSEAVSALSADRSVDVVGGRIELSYVRGRPVTGPEWYEYLHSFQQDRTLAERGYAVTANMITWRRVMERVGPFDADVLSGGDAHWGRRVRAAGGTQRYTERARVVHPARAGWRELAVKQRRTTNGVFDRMIVQPGRPTSVPRLLLGQLARVLRLSVAVWGAPVPVTFRDKARYLLACWSVAITVDAVLVRRAWRR